VSVAGRLWVVLAVALVVALAVAVLRRRPVLRARTVDHRGLRPGVHLFTSSSCDACLRARRTLSRRVDGFTELTWEDDPEWFERLGIDAVPSVVVVAEEGTARWFRGGLPPARQIPRSSRRTG
jgi:hypothetical protein